MMDSIKKDYDNQKEGEKQEEEKQAAAMCLLGTASTVGTPTCRWRRRT